MSGLVVPLAGELELLNKLLNYNTFAATDGFILKLFGVDATPTSLSSSGTFVESSFDGYAAKTLARASWNQSTTVSTTAQSSWGSAALSWTCGTNGGTVFGYWVEGQTSHTCLWAEEFTVSRVLATADVLNLTPQFSLASAN